MLVERAMSHTSDDGPIKSRDDQAEPGQKILVRPPLSSPDTNPPFLCDSQHPKQVNALEW